MHNLVINWETIQYTDSLVVIRIRKKIRFFGMFYENTFQTFSKTDFFFSCKTVISLIKLLFNNIVPKGRRIIV